MDGEEVAATLICSTSDCPVCECPKDELDRTDVVYPLRNTSKVRAAVYDAREELLEEDGTVKRGNKVYRIRYRCIMYYRIRYRIIKISHTISQYDIAYDIDVRYLPSSYLEL